MHHEKETVGDEYRVEYQKGLQYRLQTGKRIWRSLVTMRSASLMTVSHLW